MTPRSTIVVAVDFTPCSAVALEQALRLSSGRGATLRAVHAIPSERVSLVADPAGIAADLEEGITHAQWAWGEFAREVPGAEAISLEVEVGSRASSILGNARKHAAELLVLGAFGDRRPDVGFGTVATACVRHSHCDVLLVRDTQKGPFRRVVVGVDFSETSALALDRAVEFARADGAELHVLHTFEPPWRRLHYRAPTMQTSPAEQAQHRHALDERVRDFARKALRGGFESARIDVVDAPAHRSGIVEHAETIGADLVVLGTRGRSNLRDLLLGSTAEKVLAESRSSVLAVRD